MAPETWLLCDNMKRKDPVVIDTEMLNFLIVIGKKC